jgi:hypothetical protein
MHHEPASGTVSRPGISARVKKLESQKAQSPVFRGFALSVEFFWHNSSTLARALQ